MPLKEQPLLNAMKRSGAWPSFFFTSAFLSGFTPMSIAAIVGGLSIVIYTSAHGAVYAPQVATLFLTGMAIAMVITFVCLAIASQFYVEDEEDRKRHDRLCLGALLTFPLYLGVGGILRFVFDGWLQALGPLQ